MFIVISNSKYRNIGAEIIKDVKLKDINLELYEIYID